MFKNLNFNLRVVTGLIMFLIYESVGVIIIFTDYLVSNISPAVRILFAVLLFIYGFFRLYKAIKIDNKKVEEDEENN